MSLFLCVFLPPRSFSVELSSLARQGTVHTHSHSLTQSIIHSHRHRFLSLAIASRFLVPNPLPHNLEVPADHIPAPRPCRSSSPISFPLDISPYEPFFSSSSTTPSPLPVLPGVICAFDFPLHPNGQFLHLTGHRTSCCCQSFFLYLVLPPPIVDLGAIYASPPPRS